MNSFTMLIQTVILLSATIKTSTRAVTVLQRLKSECLQLPVKLRKPHSAVAETLVNVLHEYSCIRQHTHLVADPFLLLLQSQQARPSL